MTISSLANIGVSSTASAELATSAQGIADNFDTFLTLLTTQLQNQDPLEPVDTNEFTQQIVQFSSVEQQIRTNDTLEQLVSLASTAAGSAAVSFLGRGVEIETESLSLATDGGSANAIVDIATTPISAQAIITNAQGQVVRTIPLNPSAAPQPLAFDGSAAGGELALPAGTYDVRIEALDAAGQAISATITTTTRVTGVDFRSTNPQIETPLGPIEINDILSLSE